MRVWWKRGAVGLAMLAVAGVWIFWQASRTLRQAGRDVTAEQEIRFTTAPLARVLPAGYEFFGATTSFQDAAWFQGRLYLAGNAGLFAYDSQGKLETRYRAGLELPPARVTAVTQAVQSGQPEL